MYQEITYSGIVRMVRAAILNQSDKLPDTFILKDAIPEIKRHQIASLCYNGAILCGIPKESLAMQELLFLYQRHLAFSVQQQHLIDELTECFEANQIDYILLKGSELKWIYPKPDYRTMGDIDILIRTEQYNCICHQMKRLGFIEIGEVDHDFHWEKNGFIVELHKRLIPSYNKDFYSYFGDGWNIAQKKGSDHRYAMSDEDTFIFLFSHFSKHYRDSGIGIRHFVDLFVYRSTTQELDENYIISELEKLKLNIFYLNVLRTLDVWFLECEPDEVTDLISCTIFLSGAYGNIETSRISRGLKISKLTGRSKDARLIYTIKTLFPSSKTLSGKYPILKRYTFFLPFFWFVRGFNKALFQRSSIRCVLRNIQSMNPDEIDKYKNHLNAVGLDYHFR